MTLSAPEEYTIDRSLDVPVPVALAILQLITVEASLLIICVVFWNTCLGTLK